MQSVWFTETLGCCYKITLKDEKVFIYRAGDTDILEYFAGVDIHDSIVAEIDCSNVKIFGWQ